MQTKHESINSIRGLHFLQGGSEGEERRGGVSSFSSGWYYWFTCWSAR